MNTVNIKGDDEFCRYETTKNIVTSFGEDKKGLESLELKVKTLIEKFTIQDEELKEDMKYLLCYVGKRIEQIIYNID